MLQALLQRTGGADGAAALETILNRQAPNGSAVSLLNLVHGNTDRANALARLSGMFSAQPAIPNIQPPNAASYGLSDVNWKHMLDRHTYEYFDFGTIQNVKNAATMWPPGTTPAQVMARLDEAMQIVQQQGVIPQAEAQARVMLSDGLFVQVGVRRGSGKGGIVVGQFFPVAIQPDSRWSDIETVSAPELNALKALFGR